MTIRIATSSDAIFTATGAWASQPTHAVLWFGSNPMGADDFTSPGALTRGGDSYTIPSGTRYDLTFTPDGASAGEADDALVALMAAGVDEVTAQLSLHKSDPFAGNAIGTAGELADSTEPGYARKTVTFTVTKV